MFTKTKSEGIEWLFGRQRAVPCAVCATREMTKSVYMQSDTIRMVQVNTCDKCSNLPADTIISRAMGEDK